MEKFASPGKGNGLRLLKAVKPGELLYRAAPFVYIVSKKRLGGVCEHCLCRKEQLRKCSQCKVARYCGVHCQKEAWLDHKRECKCIKDIDPNFPPDSVRLVGRIIFKVLRHSVCPSEELYSFFDLQSNVDKLNEDMKEGLRHLSKTLQLYLRVEIQDVSQLLPALDIFQIFAKVTSNCFSISNGEMQDVAVGLYPSMSLLNNSCDPNCVVIFEGPQLHLRSIQEMQLGEELTISYTETMMPTLERQQNLKRQYCFECDCVMCSTQSKSKAPEEDLTQQMLQKILKGQEELKNQLKEMNKQLRENQNQTAQNTQRLEVLEEGMAEMRGVQRGNQELENHQIKMEFERMSFFLRFQNVIEADDEDLREIMTKLLAEYIKKDRQQLGWDIDLVYRVNSAYARTHNVPREVHIKFLRKTTRDEILSAQRGQVLKYKDREIVILKQIPKKVRDKRKKYSLLAKKLYQKGVWFRWLLPEGMLIFWENTRVRINTTMEAEAFMEKNKALLDKTDDTTRDTQDTGGARALLVGGEGATPRKLRSQK